MAASTVFYTTPEDGHEPCPKETCRVILNQVKQKLHLVGYLLTRYFKDARYHERKIHLDIGVLGYIGIVQHKEHSPEVLSIPPGTPCILLKNKRIVH